MILQRVNLDDPERIFMVFENKTGGALAEGDWVAHDTVTNVTGYSVVKPAGRTLSSIAGVMIESAIADEFKRCQTWGFRAGAKGLGGSGLGTSKISAGTPLVFKTSGHAAQARANTTDDVKPDYGAFPCAIGIAPTNTAAIATQAGTSGQYNVYIRCM